MKFSKVTVVAGGLLLILQHLTNGQSGPASAGGMVHAFTREDSAYSRAIPEQTQRIEATIDQRLSAITNLVCHEQIARYARKGNSISQLDTLDVNVEVLNGTERYSRIRRKEKTFSDMREVPGTWSVGEMATLLSATRDAIGLGDIRVGQDELEHWGRSLLMMFKYPASSRRWYLRANSRVNWLPFEGRVWTSPLTGEILRVTWVANDLPADSGVAQVLWTVDFSPVNLSSLMVTVPQKALYQVTYKNRADHVDWNVTSFSEYRRYYSDSAIHFDGEDQSGEK